MKNQWPIWMFVLLLIVVVLFAFNNGKEVVSLSEIFPEDEMMDDMPQITYEFVDTTVEEDPPAVEEPSSGVVTQEISKPVRTALPKPQVAPIETVVSSPPPAAAPVKAAQPKATPPTKVASSTSSGNYTVQIMASKDKTATEKDVEKIKSQGFDAFMETKDLGSKGTWYRVYIGRYETQAEAKVQLPKIKQKYKDAFIRPLQ